MTPIPGRNSPRKPMALARQRTLLLSSLLFLLCVCQGLLSSLRDAVIITSSDGGVGSIPFIQVWVLVPGALFVISLFSKLTKKVGREKAAYIVITSFLSYFLLFAWLLHPHAEQIQLTSLAIWMRRWVPNGVDGFVVMIENWSPTLYYAVCELWAASIILFFFWGIVNEMTKCEEAQRIYGTLQLGATLAPMAAGFVANLLIQHTYNPSLPYGRSPWEQTLITETLLVVTLGVIALILFRELLRNHTLQENDEKNGTATMSLKRCFRQLYRNRFIGYLAIFVSSYSVILLTTDLLWKDHMRRTMAEPQEMLGVMNTAMWFAGMLSVVGALATPSLVCKQGWTRLAIISPLLISISTALFFFTFYFGETLASYHFLGIQDPALYAVYAGAFQVSICKACRFSVGSSAKEIALSAMPTRLKWSGKAAIDTVGTQVAKAGTSIVHQLAILAFGSIFGALPFLSSGVILTLCAWAIATKLAGHDYRRLASKQKSYNEALYRS